LAASPVRVAVAAAVGGVDADDVALVHLQRGDDRVRLDAPVGADDLDVVGRPFAAVLEWPRLVRVPRVRTGEEAAVRAHPVVEDDALAATELAFAARLVVQPQLVD